MTPKQQQIHNRYILGYITTEQLAKYRDLGVITAEQYEEWYAEKHPNEVAEA